jgi:hypothetical protein
LLLLLLLAGRSGLGLFLANLSLMMKEWVTNTSSPLVSSRCSVRVANHVEK